MNLFTTQYSLEILTKHIYALPLIDILKTQKLNARFVAHYILNPQYQLTKEEENLTINDVLFFQPHLILSEILNEQLLYDPLQYDPDIEDFETCSKRN
jgi:hypothetical protein